MTDRTTLDIDFVRAQFPALDQGWAYFENAGGSLIARPVIERLTEFASNYRVQPGYPYASSARAAEILAENERLMAAMINASPDEVLIGPSTTMNVYVLSHALLPLFSAGDEVIVTNLDHEANNGAWRRLAEHGITVKEWQINPETADLEIGTLEGLLSERTRLVCVTQCSNVVGSINDIAAIAKRVHDAGAWICADAVSYAPHRRLDVKETDVDFYALSLYKLYGPHQSLLYGKRQHLLAAKGQNHYLKTEEDIPDKLDLGGVNHDLMAGIPGIVEYFDLVHEHHFPGSNADLRERLGEVFGLFAAQEENLASRFADFLNSKPNLRVIGAATGDATKRAPTFAFVVDGRDSTEFPEHMLKHKVSILADDFYAARLIDALDLRRTHNGVVRCSMVHYNTMDEVDRLIAGLDEII